MEQPITINVTVFNNAAKAEAKQYGNSRIIGWFRDEVSAIGAVSEWALMRSAILPGMRQLPQLTVMCEYKPIDSPHPIARFVRGTVIKTKPQERRVVLLPGAASKTWLSV